MESLFISKKVKKTFPENFKELSRILANRETVLKQNGDAFLARKKERYSLKKPSGISVGLGGAVPPRPQSRHKFF